MQPLLHPVTADAVERFIAHPSHALLITGASGIGKELVARTLTSRLMGMPVDTVSNHPYVHIITPGKQTSISVEAIRELEHFLSRKVPGGVPRVVIIPDAHTMTTEAQNALLKTLEDPPLNTYLLLTSRSEDAMLATIRSRSTKLAMQRPVDADTVDYFQRQGHKQAEIQKAYLMSGGLPGLMYAILQDETDHPLIAAAADVRTLIGKGTFERLAMVDSLAKQKERSLQVLSILQQMAHVSLLADRQPAVWQRVLTQSYEAEKLLLQNAQAKLVLTNLMLNL